jgi:RNA polymerase sigma-70 factor, ECF subfamily
MRAHSWDWCNVHRLALRETRCILGTTADAEDAAQEAAIRAWRRRATCRGAPAAWIRAIARNEALRVVERRRDEVPLEAAEQLAGRAPSPEPDDVLELRAAVGALDHDDRLLLLLRYWADLSQPEVARAAALPEGTVKVRLHRARRRLRLALAAG